MKPKILWRRCVKRFSSRLRTTFLLLPNHIFDSEAHSGLSQNDLLEGLSQYLPQVVDHLTPNGRMPTDQELSRSL